MLYSNTKLQARAKKMYFGTIYQVTMGEVGVGRNVITLTCPKNTVIQEGMNPDFTIITKGNKSIIKKTDDTLYLLLSAKGIYTNRGSGTIHVLSNQKEQFKVVARGKGRHGDTGNSYFWDCLLLKAPNNAIVRVRTSGAGYGTPSVLYLIHESSIYHCHIEELEEFCKNLGIDVPCKLINGNAGLQFGNDWIKL